MLSAKLSQISLTVIVLVSHDLWASLNRYRVLSEAGFAYYCNAPCC